MNKFYETLDMATKPATLMRGLPDGRVQCLACAHRCKISAGMRGICQVRYNEDGRLIAPWGYVSGLQADPIEKKPFAHFLPGSIALTYGMLGCNFHCAYCQNWFTSQVRRDPVCDEAVGTMRAISPAQVAQAAFQVKARTVVSSYNEPFITSEWSAAIFKEAKAAGLHTAFVSNGYGTPEAINALLPYLSAIKIDLKSRNDKTYRKLGGVLKHVLDTIELSLEAGLWVEVVTLLVPGMNDSLDELFALTKTISGYSTTIPWHVTGFHANYKMRATANTTAESLTRATEIGNEAGLKFVYAGNIPGAVGSYENTHCPSCRQTLIIRRGFQVLENRIKAGGKCPRCTSEIPGIWE